MARTKKAATQVHNTTPWSLTAITGLSKLGTAINTYHAQTTTLYAHPTSDALVVADVQGTWLRSITVETRRAYTLALRAMDAGQVYTSA